LEGIEAIKQDIKQSTSELQTKKQAKAAQAELEPLLNKLKDLKAKLVSSVPTLAEVLQKDATANFNHSALIHAGEGIQRRLPRCRWPRSLEEVRTH
jgi:hypothetical protein